MNSKLQELTDKIYTEGVEKGKAEAAEIIAKAEAQAAEIVAKAEAQASATLSEAEKQSAALARNTESEIKLYAQQALNSLKTDVTNLVCGTIVTDSVKAATADKAFMQKVILELVETWAKDGEVMIEAKDADALTSYFASNAKGLLNNGVTVTAAKGSKCEFAIQPANGGYKITLGDDEFIAYFKEFLRPKLMEMLF